MTAQFLLDTNVISEVNKKVPNQSVVAKMDLYEGKVATASVVVHELLYGTLRMPPESAKRTFLLDYLAELPSKMVVFDYNLNAARWHAEERARLSKIGKTPAFVDGQIASIAFCNGLVLVTRNETDFQDFEGLSVENWFVMEEE
ncbi:PIN domain-containing protein [Coleofasciculus sp. E1-EBD-02]|jgi:tRNA(fMet)-specific endonuclease VapC|uniref:PIN domain-containing protein n=2 Tax=unclassified Coleofasciculus TaxID=2692782 RepID=UPI0032F2AA00